MDGWIKVHRKIIESSIWDKPPLYLKVWMYLLLTAQHSQYKGLEPGQLVTSIPDIIEACKWHVGARIERPTRDQVFQIIDWLRKRSEGGNESNAKATMITTTKATQKMLINISNYGVYQESDEDESNGEGNGEKATKPPRKQRQPDNINKNVKNDKNDKKKDSKDLSAEIENFRSRYPSELLKIIDQYLDFIRETRSSKKIADSIILKILAYFSKYSPVQVEYAILQHMSMEDKRSAPEAYTFGIIRKSTEAEAARKLQQLKEGRKGGNQAWDSDAYLDSLKEE